jgi:hypothetical protein
MNIGDDMLEITCELAAEELLKRAFKGEKDICNSDFITMDFMLMFGDISNLDNTENRMIFGYEISVKEKISDFIKLLNMHNECRIWMSSSNIESYLNFLYIISILKKSNSSIKIILIDIKSINKDIGFVIDFSFEEITTLLPFERVLTDEDIKKYNFEWDNLVKENSILRVLENGITKSANEDYFDEMILNVLKKIGQTKASSLVGSIMGNYYKETGFMCSDFFFHRIEVLINNKMINVTHSDFNDLRYSIIEMNNNN